jgi:hypothetical protein
VTIFGIAALVVTDGYVVIQSIFRISANDKIQSYGKQLCRMSVTEGMCHALFAAADKHFTAIKLF